jgi:hypothetical protein
MASLGIIACRAIGTAGVGLALFDAVQASKACARHQAHKTSADYLEKSYFNARTIDNISANQNKIRAKTFDLKTKNPLPTVWGKTKGGINGFINSLGNSLPLVLCSTLAILGKNIVAKAGAIGIGCCLAYNIARNGFGLGKEHPMR